MAYTKHFSTKHTPQSEPIPVKNMEKNNAGGFAFKIDCWSRLDRFLILGSEKGTYYVGEQKITVDNAQGVVECVKQDGIRAVERIAEISLAGRAPKNDPAIFALALACTFGDAKTKARAYNEIKAVCRIGTHIFQFCQCIQDLRGWSRGLRKGVARFYEDRKTDDVAYQMVKYQQRDGWTHRDAMRLSHPKGIDKTLAAWAVGKPFDNVSPSMPKIVEGFDLIKSVAAADPQDDIRAVKLITEYGLPRECVPTEFLGSKAVWESLLNSGHGMPMTAMIRNLGKMTSVGLLNSAFDDSVKTICQQLRDAEAIKKARVHPLSILVALATYSTGHGMKGSLAWTPVAKIKEALNDAFYLAFQAVEPTGKNYMLGLDISGSMGSGSVAGSPLTPRAASAAMAMVTARTEPNVEMVAFCHELVPFNVTSKDTLETVIDRMSRLQYGATDCALPMIHAQRNRLPVDVFVTYTDSETWAGQIHPVQSLHNFRASQDRPQAKSIVVGMTATEFSIADPADPGMLDVVGFDTAAPAVMAEFAR